MAVYTIFELERSVDAGSEIVFEWENKEYGLFKVKLKKWVLCSDNTGTNDVFFDNIDDLMNFTINVEKLIVICTKITVIDRSLI